jgi:hypothetical protein
MVACYLARIEPRYVPCLFPSFFPGMFAPILFKDETRTRTVAHSGLLHHRPLKPCLFPVDPLKISSLFCHVVLALWPKFSPTLTSLYDALCAQDFSWLFAKKFDKLKFVLPYIEYIKMKIVQLGTGVILMRHIFIYQHNF